MVKSTFKSANQPIRRVIKTVKKDDNVKVISGKFKNKTGKVLAVSHKSGTVQIEGLGVVTRHIKPNQFNPRGGDKQVQVAIDVSKIVKVAGDVKSSKSTKPAKVQSKKETK